MSSLELKYFSKWYLQLCDLCKVPIEVASGASSMMAHLPKRHWEMAQRSISCIACVRVGYKWIYDSVDMKQLLAMTPFTGVDKSINWLQEEIRVLADLNWEIRQYFESIPISQPMTKKLPYPRTIVSIDEFLKHS